MEELRWAKIDKNAKGIAYPNEGDVGYDIYCSDGHTINPGERHCFSTGIAIEVPPGHCGMICPRSGLASKFGIMVLGGVVDPSYRGEVKVMLRNSGKEAVVIERDSRIAQLVVQKVFVKPGTEVDFDQLSTTKRGSDGFGSTGIVDKKAKK